jgi:hypothetical protein
MCIDWLCVLTAVCVKVTKLERDAADKAKDKDASKQKPKREAKGCVCQMIVLAVSVVQFACMCCRVANVTDITHCQHTAAVGFYCQHTAVVALSGAHALIAACWWQRSAEQCRQQRW